MSVRVRMAPSPTGFLHIGGVRMTAQEATENPEMLPFELAAHERGRTADELWQEAIADLPSGTSFLYERLSIYEIWNSKACRNISRPFLCLVSMQSRTHKFTISIFNKAINLFSGSKQTRASTSSIT